jgi:serine/threonine-protein kinase RsbW
MKTTIESGSEMELRIPGRPEFVRVVRKTAGTLAHQLSFTVADAHDIELAVGEACNNAIEHGRADPGEEIVVRLGVEPDRLVVEVIDQGEGFDPEEAEQGVVDGETVGGFGIIVMRSIMDEVDIRCDPKTGTCVRMIKYRPRQ